MGLLKTCCCCCSLRTGTIIIGSFSVIFWIFCLCLTIMTMVVVQVSSDKMNAKTDNGVNDDILRNFEEVIDMKSFAIGSLSLFAVSFSISVITSILLIFGASKGRRGFLLPWVVSDSLAIVAYIVIPFSELVELSDYYTGGEIFRSMLRELAKLALQIYYLLVVISHFGELRKNRRKEGSNIDAIYSAPSPRSQAQIVPNVSEIVPKAPNQY